MKRRSVQPGSARRNGRVAAREQADAWRREVQHALETQRRLKAEMYARLERRAA